MKKKILTLILTSLVLTGCAMNASSSSEASAKVITAEEAYQMMQEEDDEIVVDVRTADEYAEAHIPGAILIPNESIANEEPKLLPDKDARIMVYCRSGNRSAQAAAKLIKMGYTNVYDFGGIKNWTYETESGEWIE